MLISLKHLDAPPCNKTLGLSQLPARLLSPPLGSVNLLRKKNRQIEITDTPFVLYPVLCLDSATGKIKTCFCRYFYKIYSYFIPLEAK